MFHPKGKSDIDRVRDIQSVSVHAAVLHVFCLVYYSRPHSLQSWNIFLAVSLESASISKTFALDVKYELRRIFKQFY